MRQPNNELEWLLNIIMTKNLPRIVYQSCSSEKGKNGIRWPNPFWHSNSKWFRMELEFFFLFHRCRIEVETTKTGWNRTQLICTLANKFFQIGGLHISWNKWKNLFLPEIVNYENMEHPVTAQSHHNTSSSCKEIGRTDPTTIPWLSAIVVVKADKKKSTANEPLLKCKTRCLRNRHKKMLTTTEK